MGNKNLPDLWINDIQWPEGNIHKYTRGHALIIGGLPYTTGATRLAAYAALRAGAGLASIACRTPSLATYAASMMAPMTKVYDSIEELDDILDDEHINVVLYGPGAGITDKTAEKIFHLLSTDKLLVLDADALTVIGMDEPDYFDIIRSRQAPVIFTPHQGEFSRIFHQYDEEMKKEVTVEAAKLCGAYIVHKGEVTVIASPDGEVVIHDDAPGTLATAGTGDVLAGLITGLLANHMPIMSALGAGCWLHAEAARQFGLGLIAEDLLDSMPKAWKALKA